MWSLFEDGIIAMNLIAEVLGSWEKVENEVNFDDFLVPSIFQSQDFLKTWWECFGEGKTLFFILIKKDRKPIGFAPFYINESSLNGIKYRTVKLIGDYLTTYGDFVIKENNEQVINLILYTLQKHHATWDYVELLHISEKSPNYKEIRKLLISSVFIPYIQQCPDYPFLIIHGKFKQYFDSLSKEHRNNCRKQENRLKRLGNLILLIDEKNSPGLKNHFEAFWLSRKDRLIKMKNWHLNQSQEELEKKFIWNLLMKSEETKIFSLICGDEPIAYLIGFISGGKLLLYLSAFEPNYAYYSPGRICLKYLINYAFERNLKEIDFLIGEHSYKYLWTKESHRVNNLFLFSRTAKGKLLYWWIGEIKLFLKQHYLIAKLRNRIDKVKTNFLAK